MSRLWRTPHTGRLVRWCPHHRHIICLCCDQRNREISLRFSCGRKVKLAMAGSSCAALAGVRVKFRPHIRLLGRREQGTGSGCKLDMVKTVFGIAASLLKGNALA